MLRLPRPGWKYVVTGLPQTRDVDGRERRYNEGRGRGSKAAAPTRTEDLGGVPRLSAGETMFPDAGETMFLDVGETMFPPRTPFLTRFF